MLNPTRCLFAALLLLTPTIPLHAALAQTQPGVGTPVEPDKPPLIDAATQQKIRDYVRKQSTKPAEIPEPKIGSVLPQSVTLYTLPEDSVTELPTVTSYKFTPVGSRIAVVEPDKRIVVQLIDQ